MADNKAGSILGRVPRDLSVSMTVGADARSILSLVATIRTSHEADAVIEVLNILKRTLPSTREGTAADIGIDVPGPTFAENLAAMFGSTEAPEGLAVIEGGKANAA